MCAPTQDVARAVAERLAPHLATVLGRPAPPDLAQTLGRYAALLVEANARVNLTALVTPDDLARRHLLDALAAAPHLDGDGPLLDLGSGGGVPGLPLALALPERPVVLCESRRKKARELTRMVDALGLAPRVSVIDARAEAWLAEHPVDTVVARAVGELQRLLRLLRPVRTGFRRLVLLKGPAVDDELAAARGELARWGGTPERIELALPGGDEVRCLLCLAGAAPDARVRP